MYPLKFDANITSRSLVGNIPQDKKYKILNKEDVLFVYVFDFNIKNKKKKICTAQSLRPCGGSAGVASERPGSSTNVGLPVDRVPCKRLDEAGLFR